ncbi:MAG: class F sortase, partial [Actinomycetota bacterium]|nr:class F sortase [Actinomycetota bacterium]
LGPFAALAEAREGDEIEVRLEDGSTVTYVVETVDRQTKTGIDWDEVFVRDGPARLVLITCGGRFVRDLGHYEDNVLVTAARR